MRNKILSREEIMAQNVPVGEEEESVVLPFNCPKCKARVLLAEPPTSGDELYCNKCLPSVLAEREAERAFNEKKRLQQKKVVKLPERETEVVLDEEQVEEEKVILDEEKKNIEIITHKCEDGFESRLFRAFKDDSGVMFFFCAECDKILLEVTV
jgi:hypothetical protein